MCDGLGSVVGEVDPLGNLTCSDEYDEYGNVRGRAGTATTAHGFVGELGHLSDASTGLIYMRARYYDPSTGRFASEDPSKNGNNWFDYADDNPGNKVDQTGKASQQNWDWQIAGDACAWMSASMASLIAYGGGGACLALATVWALLAYGCFYQALDGVNLPPFAHASINLTTIAGTGGGAALYTEIIGTLVAGAVGLTRVGNIVGYSLAGTVLAYGLAETVALALC